MKENNEGVEFGGSLPDLGFNASEWNKKYRLTLKQLCAKNKRGDWPDRDSTHSYIEIYEEILDPYRDYAANVLEIGLMSGESLRMWDDYFVGHVYGIDCDIKPVGGLADLTGSIAEGYDIRIGDATDPNVIKKFFDGIRFDVVIEDAGHDITQQLQIYEAVKPYLNKGAIYICEDVQSIDDTAWCFENLDTEKEITILDRRHIKNRYDDVMVIIRDKQ